LLGSSLEAGRQASTRRPLTIEAGEVKRICRTTILWGRRSGVIRLAGPYEQIRQHIGLLPTEYRPNGRVDFTVVERPFRADARLKGFQKAFLSVPPRNA
jgi:hypothetical protein